MLILEDLMVRCKSLSVDFFNAIKAIYFRPDEEANAYKLAAHFVFDLGKVLGMADQKRFSQNANYTESNKIERVYGLPVTWQYNGWGKMDISPGFNFSSEDFYMRYTMHFSWEAEAYL
jgi:hypothetical protein